MAACRDHEAKDAAQSLSAGKKVKEIAPTLRAEGAKDITLSPQNEQACHDSNEYYTDALAKINRVYEEAANESTANLSQQNQRQHAPNPSQAIAI